MVRPDLIFSLNLDQTKLKKKNITQRLLYYPQDRRVCLQHTLILWSLLLNILGLKFFKNIFAQRSLQNIWVMLREIKCSDLGLPSLWWSCFRSRETDCKGWGLSQAMFHLCQVYPLHWLSDCQCWSRLVKTLGERNSKLCQTIPRSGSLLWHLLQERDCSREASGDDGHDGDHGVRGHGCEGHLSCVWRKGRRPALSCHSAQLSVYLQVFEAEKMIGKYGIYHQAG